MRPWLVLAGVNGLIGVAAVAYGYHWLAVADSGFREAFLTGAEFEIWHALALLGAAWLAERPGRGPAPTVAGVAFTVGIVLFSGSLYGLGLFERVLVPGAAPAGGVLAMAGWAALIWAGLRSR